MSMGLKTVNYKYPLIILLIAIMPDTLARGQNISKRNIVSLNGTWQIAEGSMNKIPENFTHTVPVPGLVSLAAPEFVNAGSKVKDRNSSIFCLC